MKIDILTLFPDMFKGPFDESIIKRAINKNLIEINIHNLRDWTKDRHKTTDNRPFGGGKGMILMIEPIYKALKQLKTKDAKIILLSPQGKTFDQKKAKSFSKEKHLIFICGHYEGVDERIRENLIDEEISIGEYILTGGELPAMVLTDTVIRLIPGVLDKEVVKLESFEEVKIDGKKQKLLDYPQYTKPANFDNLKVPEILLSGDHKKIKKYRLQKALKKTKKKIQ